MNPIRFLGFVFGVLGTGMVIKHAVESHVAEQDARFASAAVARREMLDEAARYGPDFAGRQAIINVTADRWCQDRQRDIHAAPVQSWLSMFIEG